MGLLDRLRRKTAPAGNSPPPDATAVTQLLRQADQLREQGDPRSAKALYQRALEIDAQNLYAMFWLSTMHFEAGELREAIGYCDRGLALDPDQIGLLLLRATMAIAIDDSLQALACYERVAKLDPDVPDLDALLADRYCKLGRIAEGVAAFDRAIARNPRSEQLPRSRLFVLNYGDILAPEALADEHRRWGRPREDALRAERRPFSAPRSDRPLRIGYVSPDLREHAVARFMEPLLRAHDRSQFEICCFHTSRNGEDAVSQRLRGFATEWRYLPDADDAGLADAIRGASIDIAIDLAGHTSMNRLLAFARKPAPVQASWLGYLQTTGLTAIDYRITDAYLDPPGMTEHLHTETLLRLPHHGCFDPGPNTPAPVADKAEHGRPFTFGSFNQWSKVTPTAKQLWGSILRRAPAARLLVVAAGAANPRFVEWVVSELTRLGAARAQVTVVPPLPGKAFLELLRGIDAALDTFPYGGGTTTLHALWMGVPVVTLAGRTPMSRNAVGPLTAVGLSDLVATTGEQYVEIALTLARAGVPAPARRGALRERLQASPLMDAHSFARNMENAYQTMWRAYCDRS